MLNHCLINEQSNDNNLILRRRRTRFSKESRKTDIAYHRSFGTAYGWLSAKTFKAFLSKNLGWKLCGGNSSLRMWYSISCNLKAPNISAKGPKIDQNVPKVSRKVTRWGQNGTQNWPGRPLEPEHSHKRPHEAQSMRRRGRQIGPRGPKRAQNGRKRDRCTSFWCLGRSQNDKKSVKMREYNK